MTDERAKAVEPSEAARRLADDLGMVGRHADNPWFLRVIQNALDAALSEAEAKLAESERRVRELEQSMIEADRDAAQKRFEAMSLLANERGMALQELIEALDAECGQHTGTTRSCEDYPSECTPPATRQGRHRCGK